jgi:hypothetical protein
MPEHVAHCNERKSIQKDFYCPFYSQLQTSRLHDWRTLQRTEPALLANSLYIFICIQITRNDRNSFMHSCTVSTEKQAICPTFLYKVTFKPGKDHWHPGRMFRCSTSVSTQTVTNERIFANFSLRVKRKNRVFSVKTEAHARHSLSTTTCIPPPHRFHKYVSARLKECLNRRERILSVFGTFFWNYTGVS